MTRENWIIDTRQYQRSGFVEDMINAATGFGAVKSTAAEVVEWVDENYDILDFDKELMSASRWRNDIRAGLIEMKISSED